MHPYKFLQPGHVLLYCAAILFVCLVIYANKAFDMQHTFGSFRFAWSMHPLMVVVLLAESVAYFLTSKFRQDPALRWVHVATIVIPLCGLLYYVSCCAHLYFDEELSQIAPSCSATQYWLNQSRNLLIFGQLVFFVNLIMGFVRGRKLARS